MTRSQEFAWQGIKANYSLKSAAWCSATLSTPVAYPIRSAYDVEFGFDPPPVDQVELHTQQHLSKEFVGTNVSVILINLSCCFLIERGQGFAALCQLQPLTPFLLPLTFYAKRSIISTFQQKGHQIVANIFIQEFEFHKNGELVVYILRSNQKYLKIISTSSIRRTSTCSSSFAALCIDRR